jgi:hypothetical protein
MHIREINIYRSYDILTGLLLRFLLGYNNLRLGDRLPMFREKNCLYLQESEGDTGVGSIFPILAPP